MQLECQNCHHLLNLPDSKVPVGRPFSFNCPYCKQKNTTIVPADPAPPLESESDYAPPQGDDQSPAAEAPPEEGFPPPGPGAEGQGSSERRRPVIESDYHYDDPSIQSLMLGGIDDRPKVLVVYDDEEVSSMLSEKLEAIGYLPSVAVNLRDAAKQMKFANFNILLVQEDYYGATLHSNHLLKTVQNIDIHSRRNMLVVLISPNVTTLDDLLAFSLSFDAVINTAELEGIDRLLLSIIARAKKFYAIYREILAEHGLD